MHDFVKRVTIGGLLHDIGKVLHRGTNVDGRAHSISGQEWVNKFTDDQNILDCIRYHHHQEIARAGLKRDSLAYIVYLADNISSGVDRREIEGEGAKGFDRSRPQESIYNLLNNAKGKAAHKVAAIREKINYPQEIEAYNPASDYNNLIFGLSEGLRGIDFQDELVNSLLEVAEAYWSYIPSSTYLGEVSDISLFDHSKITAALAAGIVLYLASQKKDDYHLELFENRHSFYEEKAFCLFSCDISGIQQFIYTISSKGALKGLRSRSFYLELLLENLADEILSACSLYRTNLLYTGGGHAYILLPNTAEAKTKAEEAIENINRKLMEVYDVRLFVAYGLQECSANELMNKTEDQEGYSNIFRSVAAQVSERKLRRYSAAQLRQLNSRKIDQAGRECRVCGVSSSLVERKEGTICQTCAAFTDISRMLIKPDSVFVVANQEINGPSLLLFSNLGEELFFYALEVNEVKKLLKNSPDKVVRIYSKNTYRTGFSLATKLWLGDYAVTNPEGDLKTFAELAEGSSGIRRIGVLRADVDNMGAAFVNGFIRENAAENKYRYLTLSRTATLSRSLSIFFKYYLNDLLENGEYSLLAPEGKRNVVVVYAGGDDLFIVGAWNEVLCAAIDIRRAFARYTGNTLTMSAGFAIFEPGYPITRMAAETADLEAKAKDNKYLGGVKNSISLLGLEMNQEELKALHTYDWDTFENQVLEEKYVVLDSIFSHTGDYGNSFLYNILDLLRQAEVDTSEIVEKSKELNIPLSLPLKLEPTINIARLAYLLARREPGQGAAAELKQNYRDFAQKFYRWALNPEEGRQLTAAIIIFTYYNREEKEVSRNERYTRSISEGWL